MAYTLGNKCAKNCSKRTIIRLSGSACWRCSHRCFLKHSVKSCVFQTKIDASVIKVWQLSQRQT